MSWKTWELVFWGFTKYILSWKKNFTVLIHWILDCKKALQHKNSSGHHSRMEISLPHILTEIKPPSAPQQQQARKLPASWEPVESPSSDTPLGQVHEYVTLSQNRNNSDHSGKIKAKNILKKSHISLPFFPDIFSTKQSVWEHRIF